MSFLRRRNKNLAPQTQPETQETPVMAAVAGNLAMRLAARGPEVSKRDLEQNLADLKAAAEAAKSELRASAPPERLTPPGSRAPLEDGLFHMADWSERLIIEDDHALNPWQYARPGQYDGPYDIPEDAPKGQRVTVMGGSDPNRPELGAEDPSLRRGYTELLFMNDGRTMYKAYAGIQRSEYWAEVQELPLDQALALTDYVAASVEAHRQNP